MNESKESPRRVKVVDRRKFTSAGDPRDEATDASDALRTESTPEEAQPVKASAERPMDEVKTTESSGAQSSVEFLELVAMLAQQAEILLVGTEDLPAQPAEAQRVINYLGALEEKTAGNLSSDEAQILQNLVFQLRTLFLQNSHP